MNHVPHPAKAKQIRASKAVIRHFSNPAFGMDKRTHCINAIRGHEARIRDALSTSFPEPGEARA